MGAWWGYLLDAGRSILLFRLKPGLGRAVVMPTRAGRQAIEIWGPLAAEIEAGWRERFGATTIEGLRQALQTIIGEADELPDYLPILGYGLFSRPAPRPLRLVEKSRPLIVLLAKALLSFAAVEFEAESDVRLAVLGQSAPGAG